MEVTGVTKQGIVADWLSIVRGEFMEVPGLRLTRVEFQRMWGLDNPTCDALIGELEDSRFLRRTTQGAYVRADCPA